MTMDGRTYVVTGGASGIGLSAVEILVSRGANVLVADLNEQAGAVLIADISARGGKAAFARCDIADERDVQDMVQAALSRFGTIDGAFNNAGIGQLGLSLAEVSLDQFRRAMDINVVGTFLCMKYEIAAMLEADGRGGSIVNTASAAGVVGMRQCGEYSASKHAVVGLSRSAAADYGARGIRVNAIAPGAVRTPLLQGAMDADPSLTEYIKSAHPIGRIGEPEELGAAAVWLLSDAASYVTGACLSVDGGFTAV